MGIIVLSAVAYFVSSYFISRELEALGIPRSRTRGAAVFALSLAIAYAVAYVVELILS